MAGSDDLLLEVGTEELPPTALRTLMNAFAEHIAAGLEAERLEFDEVRAYASPRRLAVIVKALAGKQADQVREHKGPPVSIAFDDSGEPTPAALAFARKLGVTVDDLGRSKSAKGEWLSFSSAEPGVEAGTLLPGIANAALAALPVPRPMRWGNSSAEFVRPVHWIVGLHGERVIEGQVMDTPIGNVTRGHRFMAPTPIVLADPGEYVLRLEDEGFVIVDFAERRGRVEQQVASAATACGGTAVVSDALFDEVAALVEWPVAITGRFDEAFLNLPREVIVATLTGHQRYFPVEAKDGSLLPAFITLANLESKDPDQVRRGNERVVQPRLADAMFFWDADRRTPLADRRAALDDVIYQKGLGTLGEKSTRVEALVTAMSAQLGVDAAVAKRAAQLAKCDLVTGMVGEFPELQGTMGRYYATSDGEPEAVATAIEEQYRPRFAGDRIAASAAGRLLACADRLDTLCGIFALGKKPSGNRDPFGLRRAALGIVRTLLEGRLDLDLAALIDTAYQAQPLSRAEDGISEVYAFIVERMRAHCLERDDLKAVMFDAVRSRRPASLLDFEARLDAVAAFVQLPSAESLAAANKRIGNILRKAGFDGDASPVTDRFIDDAERDLHAALESARQAVDPLLAERQYGDALKRLAELREPVDRFFDDVMVMADDADVRHNRLALLSALRGEFLRVADISRLSIK